MGALSVRSKPLTDAEELLPLCYRCSSPNPLLGGNECTVCKHPLVTSAHSREVLPLVEFVPEEGLDERSITRLINNDTGLGARSSVDAGQGGDTQVMSMDADEGEDPFLAQLQQYESGSAYYEPIVAPADMIKSMPSSAVFQQASMDGGPTRYWYNVLPEMGVSMCNTCHRVRLARAHGPGL